MFKNAMHPAYEFSNFASSTQYSLNMYEMYMFQRNLCVQLCRLKFQY